MHSQANACLQAIQDCSCPGKQAQEGLPVWFSQQVAGAVSQLLGLLCQPSMLLADSRNTPGASGVPGAPAPSWGC